MNKNEFCEKCGHQINDACPYKNESIQKIFVEINTIIQRLNEQDLQIRLIYENYQTIMKMIRENFTSSLES